MSDRFQLVRKLTAQGACGTVFLAKDSKTGLSVVVKQLSASDVRSSTERRVMRNLRHQNIVRFLDSWFTTEEITTEQAQQQLAHQGKQADAANPLKPNKNGKVKQRTLNIAMEFVGGGDLRAAIRARRGTDGVGFPEPVIRKWLVQICSALFYCHSQHILHRDLKAENILLDESSATIKVADFGFAKELAQSDAFTTTRLGTPHSLPPEVYDATPYNNRADMWCVGIILYEIMTLARPFLGNTMQELFQTIMKNEPNPVEIVSKNRYSKELYELQKRLLSKNPKLRPSAREVLSFAWAAPLLKEVRLNPMSEEQRVRDRAVWDRISVQAEYHRTTLMELCLPNTTVNVRDCPSFSQSKIVMQLQPGDFIECVDEIIDVSGTRWLRTTRGYCIKVTPMPPPREMFRRIAEWRVRRPSASGSPNSNRGSPNDLVNNNNSSNTTTTTTGSSSPTKLRTPAGSPVNVQTPTPNQQQQQERPNSLFGADAGTGVANNDEQLIRINEEAAKKALETQIEADKMPNEDLMAQHKLLNSALIENGMNEGLLEELISRYKTLAAPLDDMPWTIYCVDALRPLRMVPWVPVVRWVALISEALVAQLQQQQQGGGTNNINNNSISSENNNNNNNSSMNNNGNNDSSMTTSSKVSNNTNKTATSPSSPTKTASAGGGRNNNNQQVAASG